MKIHLDIRDDIPPTIALECVRKVVADGRVSNNGTMYCYATHFYTSAGRIWVTTRGYRKSDCFLIVKHKEENNEKDYPTNTYPLDDGRV